MRINFKYLFFTLLATSLIFITSVHLINLRFEKISLKNARQIADTYAELSAQRIESQLNSHLATFRSLALTFGNLTENTSNNQDELCSVLLDQTLKQNDNYVAVFLQWDLQINRRNPLYSRGRSRESHYIDSDGSVKITKDLLDLESEDSTSTYFLIKNSLREFVLDPYYYSYKTANGLPHQTPISNDDILETTIVVPIIKEDKFYGLTGADIPVGEFRTMIDSIQPYKNSSAFLLSGNGKLIFHNHNELTNSNFTDIYKTNYSTINILEKMNQGMLVSFQGDDPKTGELVYVTLAPVKIGNSGKFWSLGVVIPIKEIYREAHEHVRLTFVVVLLGLLLITIIISFISNNITQPLKSLTHLFQQLADGDILNGKGQKVFRNDEIGEMTISANVLLEKLNRTALFAREIGMGNYEAQYELLSKKDVLGSALIEMRNNLSDATLELKKLSLVASKTDNAISIMNPEGYIEWVNPTLLQLLEISIDSVLGKHVTALSQNPEMRLYLDQCLTTKKSVRYANAIRTKKGRNIWMQTTITPVISESGIISHLISIDSDITNIKEAEQKIKEQRDKIEFQKNELEQLVATRDKFFSIIAHDMKNPWTSLLSITQSLAENGDAFDDSEMRYYLSKVFKSADLIHSMLHNLLLWANSQTGKMEFNAEKCNLFEMTQEVFTIYSFQSEKKKIQLINEIPEKLIICGDRNMVIAILRNLINNAIKFTPEEGCITVYSENVSNRVWINVRDTGIGMNHQDLESIFRLDVKTKSIGPTDKERGTGLGLILCKEFVEAHKGIIEVISNPGEGSNFRFSLPDECY